ncbi:conserved hypothetical protein [Candidatus Sulfopaludibacter sp. SbA3]|nr:conserved hypothetical protein [Candidatus Sulfopaludibacter sp. SbA3]
MLLAGVALTAAPWLIRSTILTGNPVAPLANDLFRNPYFHLRTGSELASNMRSLHGIPPSQVPWELAFGDRLTGTFGPLLYLLPLGLLSLGTRTGRICVGAALILAVPWWSNTGARFLMPAAMLAAFALAMVLPRKVAWAVIALQALVCWPPLLNTWQPPYTFRLHEIPWKAAFGMETKEHYLQNHVPEYNVARMVEHYTAPDAGIFSLIPVATAYVARDISVSWQSAGGECLTDALNVAAKIQEQPLYDWTATWPPASLRGVRFRMPVELSREWDLAEVQLFSGDDRLYNSPSWSLRAWPNVWEATLAFDNRRSTVWRTWEPTRRGMFLEVDFDHAQLLSAAVLTSHNGPFEGPLEFHGQGPDGKWRLLSNRPSASQRPPEDLRLEATGVIRRAGYQYLLVPLGPSGNGPLGKQIQEHAPQWGLVAVGNAGPNVLFKLR